jgi:hypothetical protein
LGWVFLINLSRERRASSTLQIKGEEAKEIEF